MKRMLAMLLATILVLMIVFPYLPPFPVKAAENQVTLTSAFGDTNLGHKLYCIDKGSYAVWGVADDGDVYEKHSVSNAEVPLSSTDARYIFWAMLTLKASLGDDKANGVIQSINNAALASGKTPIGAYVSEEDLKTIIYSAATRAKYSWIETVAANSEEYMKMGGLITGGGGGSTVGGKKVPDVIAANTTPASAYLVDKSTLTIQFAADGSDADFIQTVPIEFSNNGGVDFYPTPTDGWTYTKTDTSITFTNPNPKPPQAMIQFKVEGTPYASAGGGYSSVEDVLESTLQIWECVTCSGGHVGNSPATLDPWLHQRMVWMEIDVLPRNYFASLAGDPIPESGGGSIQFKVYRHEEDFTSTYNVQLEKYDHETGKPLQGSRFVLYERFDDKDEVDTERDGPVHLYEGGGEYAGGYTDDPVLWDGFRRLGTLVTDTNGHIEKTIEHGYHYDKTFCDGHPAPVFVPVPEPEIEEDEDGNEEVVNQAEIDAAKAENQMLAETWLQCVSDCEEKASGDFEGVHFHWIMPEVDQGEISSVASSGGEEGSTPDAGKTESASGEESYEKSGCQADCQETYDKFISMRYSYAFEEFQAREGYILHYGHNDDLPIEIIRTDASENGANSEFAGYTNEAGLSAYSAFQKNTGSLQEAPALLSAGSGDMHKSTELLPVFSPRMIEQRLLFPLDYALAATASNAEEELEEESTAAEKLEEPEEESTAAEKLEEPEEESTATEKPEEESTEAEKLEEPKEESTAAEEMKETAAAEKSENTEGSASAEKPEATEESVSAEEPEETEKPAAAEKKTEKETKKTEEEPPLSLSPHETGFVRSGFEFIDEDGYEPEKEEENEEAGKAAAETGTGSAAMASPSSLYTWSAQKSLYLAAPLSGDEGDGGSAGGALFEPAYQAALTSASVGASVTPGDPDRFSHCNGADGEGDMFRVYDHRTEGEIHLNKRDLDLAAGESDSYSAYGDTQGDSTLEGAVYGLFAADDIVHPDGKTGVVYRKNNLVSVASTDKNGDASFLVFTEAPGRTYDYKTGTITATGDGFTGPQNLYTANVTIDDYTEDSQHVRTYVNNAENNGNCWIGRPLIMGDYYIKELSRSEGYELSIGNKGNAKTNFGQDVTAGAGEEGNGHVSVVTQMYGEEQTGEGGPAGPNEIFFAVESMDTDGASYDLLLTNLPEGAKLYRKDVGTEKKEVEVGTGTYEEVDTGIPAVAENDYQYPKYNADGSLMQVDQPINYVSDFILHAPGKTLDASLVTSALTQKEGTMTADQVAAELGTAFDLGTDLKFVKIKVEAALRRNGKATPSLKSGGTTRYSDMTGPVYDGGVREGEAGIYGLSGVTPGQPAAYTVYGSPVQTLSIEKTAGMTVEQLIRSILDYYNTNSYLSYGGIDSMTDVGDRYLVTVYAGIAGKPDDFMVTTQDGETILYHGVPYIPDDTSLPPRFIYASYAEKENADHFGTYADFSSRKVGSTTVGSATFITDAVADGAGNLHSKTVKETVYYKTGETPRDKNGAVITKKEYKEITVKQTIETEKIVWVPLSMNQLADGNYLAHIQAAFTDSFGKGQTNAGVLQTLDFKAVLPENTVILTGEDVSVLGNGFEAGKPMNTASYYPLVKKARAKAYLNYENMAIAGEDSYIETVTLTYPGQNQVYEDAGTRLKAVGVKERIIRQKVKISKDIRTAEGDRYDFNTNAASGHEDSFTTGAGADGQAADALPNFRFKAYLKSNLERLYRNEAGEIAWLDRDGKEVDITEYEKNYPEMKEEDAAAQKLFTRVEHRTDSDTAGSVSNNVWESAVNANESLYSYGEDGLLLDHQNPGYTRLLETITVPAEDGAGTVRFVSRYNYEKFFAALQAANQDVWDKKDASSTSFKPLAWIRAAIFGTGGGEKADPVDHNNEAIQNTANTGTAASEVARRSDAVRQFAIDWYLEDEVKKRTETNGDGERQPAGGEEPYQDSVYDESLYAAILKAENYLKPFYAYDLDEIYAVRWDSAPEGGSDKDATTLSGDTEYAQGEEHCCYGVSRYLPCGTYDCVEQQPEEPALSDFANQHYQTDLPKEIEVPSVYEPAGNQEEPEKLHAFYQYTASDTPQELAGKYQIRMNEEWAGTNSQDQREYVIRAHNNDGDFEVFKYGLSVRHLTGTITYEGGTYPYQGFSIVQEESDPFKDVYAGENAGCDYPVNHAVEQYYAYASLAEQAGTADDVRYLGGETDDNNPFGYQFKDQVKTITGALTGYDGLYFQALVPYSVTEPAASAVYSPDDFQGYADRRYHNTFYTAKLRIEKLDSETGESLLHDGAEFAIYAAEREDSADSEGRVRFYERDTEVTASREFLTAMGAKEITPVDKSELIPSTYPCRKPYTGLYTGIIPAGTPICREEEQVTMADESGIQTGTFRVFSTLTDFVEGGEEHVPTRQNAGYLETPQPLGAGVYVLCEMDPPAGYARTKPIAVEVYSDEVTYYLDGDRDNRVAAAIYEEAKQWSADNGEPYRNEDGTVPNYNKQRDFQDLARIYVNNTPIRLEVSKVKQDDTEILYELNERVEGTLTQLDALYGLQNLELAYNESGFYLGYGWPKGFLDALKKKQAAGEKIEILYEDGVFTGRAILTRTPATADDTNRYLPGATMTLYEAIPVTENGDSGDRGYSGVNVVRDSYGNVTRMYVEKGYAGKKTLYVKDKDVESDAENDYTRYTYQDALDDAGAGTWISKTVEREDTDILYYDLGALQVFTEVGGKRCGYDREGTPVQLKDGQSIFALKDGSPYLEIVCLNYGGLSYSTGDRLFDAVPEGTEFYHLDSEGNRDARVDPYTGMAYTTEEGTGTVMVWPVKLSFDAYGNVIAKEKIKTGRLATMRADTEEEYVVGTYDGVSLKPGVNPVLKENGLPEYYQRSLLTYRKGEPVYDRDGDYVRYKYSDLLEAFDFASWEVVRRALLENVGDPEDAEDDLPLYHRQGESYLIENTWVTGETTPNDPFDEQVITEGQVDVLKRVPSGFYILEEVTAPEGYEKILPMGISLEESREVHTVRATDAPISIYVEKIDAPEEYELVIRDYDGVLPEHYGDTWTEGKGSFTYAGVEGATIALFAAKRVPTSDLEQYPNGYYLEKISDKPFEYQVLGNQNEKVTVTAQWTVGKLPVFLEGIPAGEYILEETDTPDGYVPASMEVTIAPDSDLQTFTLYNDHIKAEFLKYEEKDGKKEPLPNAYRAELALYEAVTDENGIVYDAQGLPRFDSTKEVARWQTDDCIAYTEGADSFKARYESLYRLYERGVTDLNWQGGAAEKESEETTDGGESVRQLWDLGNGKKALVQATKNLLPDGTYGYAFDFKFNYETIGTIVSYDTPEGRHRLDYLPLNGADGTKGYYVLVETETPAGYRKADPKPVVIEKTADIQLYGLENEPKYTWFGKEGQEKEGEETVLIAGAEMAVYRAEPDGSLIKDEAHLVERWIAGSEGTYMETDKKEGKIPAGYEVGDLRLHLIKPLAYGTYYLCELSVPEGFTRMPDQKFEVTASSDDVVTGVDVVKKGKIKIEKTDTDDQTKLLSGAVFSVRNRETGETVEITTNEKGLAETPELVTGRIEDGRWVPYHFEVTEIKAPDYYQLQTKKWVVVFTDASAEEVLTYELTVTDEKTRISISKTDFESGLFVKGAKLAIYQVKTENGEYVPDGEPVESWVSTGTAHVVEGKLLAGHMYLLKELSAPDGYVLQEPYLFTVAEDGRRISAVTDQRNVIEVKTADSLHDAVERLSIQGRKGVRLEAVLTDRDTGEETILPDGHEPVLSREDGLSEGHRYTLVQRIIFSDGSIYPLEKMIFRLTFGESGTFPIPLRRLQETRLKLVSSDGTVVEEWSVENTEGYGYRHEIVNKEYESPVRILVTSENGKAGAAVQGDSIIRYEITYRNDDREVKDLVITAELSDGLTFMPANSSAGAEKDGTHIHFTIPDAEPGEEGSLTVTASVELQFTGFLSCVVSDGSREACAVNPAVPEGALTVLSTVSGTDETLKEEEITYHITIRKKDGSPFYGSVSYVGSHSGTIRSGESVTLKAGEYISIIGLAWGSQYEVSVDAPEDAEPVYKNLSGTTKREGVSVIAALHRNDPSERELLKKGETYRLEEKIILEDGEELTNVLSFTLNEEASLDGIGVADRKTKVSITKTDLGGRELPGAHLVLKDADGNVVDEWDSTDTPLVIEGVLKPGESYTLYEEAAPDGYAYAEEITFTVSEDGTPDAVSMQDKPTQVEISKKALTGKDELPGARLELRDESGALIESWVSGTEPHRIVGKLIAGKTYTLREIKAPDGYWTAEEITFTVSLDGTVDHVEMRDKETEVKVRKYGLKEDGKTEIGMLSGARLQIFDSDGKKVADWYTDGKEKLFIGLLNAGETYTLREAEAPAGFGKADPVSFTVPDDGSILTVRMDDILLHVGERTPEGKPPVPENPTEGYITVRADREMSGHGRIELEKRKLSPLPPTGDFRMYDGTKIFLYRVLFAGVCMVYVSAAVTAKRRKKCRFIMWILHLRKKK